MNRLASELLNSADKVQNSSTDVQLIYHTQNGDKKVAASLLNSASQAGISQCLDAVDSMNSDQLTSIFKTALANMEFYDSPPREFEHAQLTFEVSVSAASYGQLKRHRMMSQTVQQYDPSLGLTIPQSIKDAGMEQQFTEHAAKAEKLFYKIKKDYPDAAPYALTNAHRRKVLLTTNMRELYHFSRLREDAHAQWDIRILAAEMRKEVEKVMPLSALLLCGKDSFVSRFEKIYGHRPKIDPAAPSK
jgi:hypothetical protein